LKTARSYQAAAPDLGLDWRMPSTLIDDRATPACLNVRFRGGEVRKRTGREALGGAVEGVPVLLHAFRRLSGVVTPMLATTTHLYRWDGAAWDELADGLSGDEDGWHSATVLNDTWVYSNGVDPVMKWTGSGAPADLGGATDYGAAATHRARQVANYADRLVLLSPWESGSAVAQRVRWSELGKLEEWDEAEGGGYADLTDDPGGVRWLERLGDWAVVYCAGTIWRMTFLGPPVVFHFSRVVTHMGLRARRTVTPVAGGHFFMGDDDLYVFDGSAPRPIGARVRDRLFGAVPPARRSECHASTNLDRNEVRLYVPWSAEGDVDRAVAWDYQQDVWSFDTAPSARCAASVEMGTVVRIDDLGSDPIAALGATRIDDLGGYEGRRFFVMADADGQAWADSGLAADDGDAAVDGWLDTKDYPLDARYVSHEKRVLQVEFEARGSAVALSASGDQGGTWESLGTVALGPAWTRHRVDCDLQGRTLRLRFRNAASGGSFRIRWWAARYVVGAER